MLNNVKHFIATFIICLIFPNSLLIAGSDIYNTCTIIHHGGQSFNQAEWFYRLYKCEQDTAIKKGEYETKEEFENRKKTLQYQCSSLNKFSGMFEQDVRLRYSSERQQFYFSWDDYEGGKDCHYPFRKYSNLIPGGAGGGYKIDVSKYDYNIDKSYFDSVERVYYHKTEDRSSRARWTTGRDLIIRINSRIDKARLLKTKENSLKFQFRGEFSQEIKYRYYYGKKKDSHKSHFEIHSISIFDQETNSEILKINFQ